MLIQAVAVYLPVYAYRLSLKGTAAIWLPLIWILRPAVLRYGTQDASQGSTVQKLQLDEIRHGASFLVVRMISLVVLLCLILRIMVLAGSAASRDALENWLTVHAAEPLVQFIGRLIAPGDVKVWHLSAMTNCFLVWGMWIWADKAIRYDGRWPDELVRRIIRVTMTARRVLTVYTLFNTVGILVAVANLLQYVDVDWTWFAGW